MLHPFKLVKRAGARADDYQVYDLAGNVVGAILTRYRALVAYHFPPMQAGNLVFHDPVAGHNGRLPERTRAAQLLHALDLLLYTEHLEGPR